MPGISHRMPVRSKRLRKRSTKEEKEPKEEKEKEDIQENKGWQFVNLGQSEPNDRAEQRKVVRTNAMRHYRKSQRERRNGDAVVATEANAHASAAAHSPLVRRTRDDGSPWLTGNYQTWPNEWDQMLDEARRTCLKFGSGNLDPFESLPVKGNPQACELLHHCKLLVISIYHECSTT